jgi:hypothetical protein
VGETDFEVTPETSPIPLSMLTAVAPETLQDNVDPCPAVIVEGVAVNQFMVGAEAPVEVPTCTCWLAAGQPLADAVMIADPRLTPLTFGADAAVVAPPEMKMFVGATVTFEVSLLVNVMNTPLAGAGVASVTWNSADSPGNTVTLAGKTICPPTGIVPTVTVT